MNLQELLTLFQIIVVIFVTRIWGLPGGLSYAATFAILAMVFR
jgi:ABC-type anion transport system duplicated permease subunit